MTREELLKKEHKELELILRKHFKEIKEKLLNIKDDYVQSICIKYAITFLPVVFFCASVQEKITAELEAKLPQKTADFSDELEDFFNSSIDKFLKEGI